MSWSSDFYVGPGQTIASGDMTHYVGTQDVTMVHSVVDISLNRITRPIFAAAAG
ncbi:MAG: Tm-1-like ATP-binding domain-containing protein, partial [Nitrospinota bacterium]